MVYITRTNIFVLVCYVDDSEHHLSQWSHVQPAQNLQQGGKSEAWVEDHSLLLLRLQDVYTASAIFSYFLQLIKHQHWYWCGPASSVPVSVIDLILNMLAVGLSLKVKYTSTVTSTTHKTKSENMCHALLTCSDLTDFTHLKYFGILHAGYNKTKKFIQVGL